MLDNPNGAVSRTIFLNLFLIFVLSSYVQIYTYREQLQVVVGVWSSFNFLFFFYLLKPEKWKRFYYVISLRGKKDWWRGEAFLSHFYISQMSGIFSD